MVSLSFNTVNLFQSGRKLLETAPVGRTMALTKCHVGGTTPTCLLIRFSNLHPLSAILGGGGGINNLKRKKTHHTAEKVTSIYIFITNLALPQVIK